MVTNCLAECAYLTITVSEIERDIGWKSSFFHTPLAFDAPVREFPSEHRRPVWFGKTRMAWLPNGEKISKISLVVLAQLTNVTDRRTDRQMDRRTPHAGNSRAMHTIARQKLTAARQVMYNKKLSCRRETARRFVSLNISPSHPRSFEMTLLSRGRVYKSLLIFQWNYVSISYCTASNNDVTLK